jgi:glyoxylase-like metal-dependent hydrolase (beta-lactamase superfamily II)
MHVSMAPLWLAATNCYVVSAEAGGPAVIVDAPPDVDAIVEIVRRAGVIPQALLLTHGHLDHMGGADGVAGEYRLSTYLHPDDDFLVADPENQVRWLLGASVPGDFAMPERYEHLANGQVLDLAGVEYRVLHTPGHTPGHCCFHVAAEGVLFSGDLLFAGSIGRTDLPGGDYDTLMRSMAEQVVPLPEDTDVLPGHGPTTTLARELATNPFLQELRA